MRLVDDQEDPAAAFSFGSSESLGSLGKELEAMEAGTAAESGDQFAEQADGAGGRVGELCG